MIPTNSGRTSPCDPISSNCVIWQGPDIPCIEICNGDTISDVTAKMAELLCDILEGTCLCDPDMTSVDIKCLDTLPPFDQTVQGITGAIITYICNLTPGTTEEQICSVPNCFATHILLDPLITQLPICDFANELANYVCIVRDTLNSLQTQITINETDIDWIKTHCCETNLELPTMKSVCVMGDNISLFPMDLILHELESAYCGYIPYVGTIDNDINPALAAQCISSANYTLNNPNAKYPGEYPDWIDAPSNLAQSTQDLWVVVCDMHMAMLGMMANCCPKPCEGIIYDFTAQMVGAGVLNINWNLSDFPPPIQDCNYGQPNVGSVVTVNDENGHTKVVTLQPVQNEASAAGQDIDVSSLDLTNFTVTVEFCVNDGPNVCTKTVIKTVAAYLICPSPVTLTPTPVTCAYGFNGTTTDDVTYQIEIFDNATNVSAGGPETFVNPGLALCSGVFGGLSHTKTYKAVITMYPTSTPASQVICQAGIFTTPAINCSPTPLLPGGFVGPAAFPFPGLAIGTRQTPGLISSYQIGDDANMDPEVEFLSLPIPGVETNTPVGTDLGTNELSCDGGPIISFPNSSWWLVDVYTTGATIDYYIFANWDLGPAPGFQLNQVQCCCDCPTTILDDATFECTIAGSATILPVSTVFAPSSYQIGTNPAAGVAVCNALTGETVYTHGGTDTQNDSFTIIVTTPGCGQAEALMQVEIRTVNPPVDIVTDLWFVINTDTVSVADAADIATEVQAWHAANALACPGPPSNQLFIVCSSSAQVLSCATLGIDLGWGLAAPPLAYQPFEILPSNWLGAGVPGPNASLSPDNYFTMIFWNEGSTGVPIPYHDAALANGFLAQPNPAVFDYDWDALQSLQTGVGTGTWHAGLTPGGVARYNAGAPPTCRPTAIFQVRNIAPVADSGAFIFFLFGAGSATIMPQIEYLGKDTTPTNCCAILTACLDAGAGSLTTNPYALYSTAGPYNNPTAGGLQSLNVFTGLNSGSTYNINSQLQADINGFFAGYTPGSCQAT